MMRWRMFGLGLLLAYGVLFYQQERMIHLKNPQLSFPLPTVVQKAVLGYLRQLSAEMHFVKTSVFLGNRNTDATEETNAKSLERNFHVMAELHPLFADTYFLGQSALAYQGEEHTRGINKVLEKGIAAMPEEWILPFFKGFNHFFYLKENRQAADELLAASKLPGAASWLGRLASKLAAEEGDIINGLIWLKAILQTEKDEQMRDRYEKDIAIFEKAYAVQSAIHQFRKKYGNTPEALEELIPEFQSALPDLGNLYYLEWEPPVLRLKRQASAK